jgi:parallel beta-helix repeat protein
MINSGRDSRYVTLVLGLILGITGPAYAVDGVLEINQACAVNTGCFSGDTAGFPVDLNQAGSYRLTSNLTVNENTRAITVGADNVTIDLNGFSILGPVACSAPPVSCAPAGTGSGIVAGSDQHTNTTVRNGTIQGMGEFATGLNELALVEDVQVISNGVVGIVVGESSIVRDCISFRNRSDGIVAGGSEGSTITGNVANENGQYGIKTGPDSTVTGNTANANGSNGIEANSGGTVSGNTASRNGLHGLRVFGGAVLGNTARDNGLQGLSLTSDTGYANNVLSGNNGGNANPQVTGGAIEIGANLCGNDTICP